MASFLPGRRARWPVARLLLIGGVLVVVDALRRPESGSAPSGEIVIGASDLTGLRREWAGAYGTTPGPREERRLVDAAIDEAVLHRAALSLGVDRDDPLVRTRLAQLVRLVDDGPLEDEDELEQEARARGLDRSDVVTRRHLAQAVGLLAAGPPAASLPSTAVAAAFYEQHRDAYALPRRQRLTHVFLSADRRGDAIERDASSLLARLRSDDVAPERAADLGDAFVRDAGIGLESDAVLDRAFGPGFAETVASLPVGTWAGPVRSTYGVHLVWVHERAPAGVPPLDAVRNRVVLRMQRERRDARRQAVVAGLRERYAVRVEVEDGVEPDADGN